ncbi:MAG: FixH family protein [Bacteroidaceae bacterium]|nr:FixH family protein [Bacteroidaceae bacterium]
MKKVKGLFKGFFMIIVVTVLVACSSNDDGVQAGIEIPGITITDDINCCSAEEALQVYRFLQTVKIIPELQTEIDDKYNVYAFTRTGTFHVGYNEIFFVATNKATGNYIKNFELKSITPLMYMSNMNMYHSTPIGETKLDFDDDALALKSVWVSFLMNTSEAGSWTLSYDAQVLGKQGGLDKAEITVKSLPEGQQWLKSFKIGSDTYYLSLVNPLDFQTGINTIRAYISKKNTPITTPYPLSSETFTIEIDPRMPDMDNHTSPDNIALSQQSDGSYQGSIKLTMTGLWRIHLTVRDKNGNVVAGGDTQSNGYSSLYWDVTI